MMALDGLPLLRTNETAVPAKARPVGFGKAQAPGRQAQDPAFEDVLQSEQNAERAPAYGGTSTSEETKSGEGATKKSLREERPSEKSETKRRLHPTSVRTEGLQPDGVNPPVTSVKDLEAQSLYERPDFFEAPVDGPKVKTKMAVERFLTAMKTEVGVSADQVIRAIKTLPSDAMVVSPQQNMQQVLGALKLSPEKQASAETLYKGMVSQLGDTNVGLDIERYSPKFLERQAWLDNVDQISQRFFLRSQGPAGFSPSDARLEGTNQIPKKPATSEEASREPFGVALAPTAASVGVGLGAFTSVGAIAGVQAGLGSQPMASAVDLRKQTQLGHQVSELNGEVESLALAPASTSANSVPLAAPATLSSREVVPSLVTSPQAPPPVKFPAKAAAPVLFSSLLKEEGATIDEGVSEEKIALDSDAPFVGTHESPRGGDPISLAEEVTPLAAPIQSRDPIENLKELNQSAVNIAKDGGGEITMKLKPEGLGEVKLKVMVENGRVNVEMIADNPETKRILESQSFDLKKSLEGQMIQVDGLKIDVRDQQTQNDRHSSQNQFDREMAKDFLGQFRDQNQSFRQSFFELPNVKAYRGTSKQAEDVRPSQVVRPRSDSSKRLNLVA